MLHFRASQSQEARAERNQRQQLELRLAHRCIVNTRRAISDNANKYSEHLHPHRSFVSYSSCQILNIVISRYTRSEWITVSNI